MDHFYKYRGKILKQWRVCHNHLYTLEDNLFIFNWSWRVDSYYDRLWRLTDKKQRPIGLKTLWLRKSGFVTKYY